MLLAVGCGHHAEVRSARYAQRTAELEAVALEQQAATAERLAPHLDALATYQAMAGALYGQPGAAPSATVARAEAAACRPSPTEGYSFRTGYALSVDQARALAEARASVRASAVAEWCTGITEDQCAELTRHVEDWGGGYWNPETYRACAIVAVRRSFFEPAADQ